MRALVHNETGEVVPTLKDIKPVGCRWIFTIKYNIDRTISRHKAMLVAKEFAQMFGIDYLETFAPVAKLNT